MTALAFTLVSIGTGVDGRWEQDVGGSHILLLLALLVLVKKRRLKARNPLGFLLLSHLGCTQKTCRLSRCVPCFSQHHTPPGKLEANCHFTLVKILLSCMKNQHCILYRLCMSAPRLKLLRAE